MHGLRIYSDRSYSHRSDPFAALVSPNLGPRRRTPPSPTAGRRSPRHAERRSRRHGRRQRCPARAHRGRGQWQSGRARHCRGRCCLARARRGRRRRHTVHDSTPVIAEGGAALPTPAMAKGAGSLAAHEKSTLARSTGLPELLPLERISADVLL